MSKTQKQSKANTARQKAVSAALDEIIPQPAGESAAVPVEMRTQPITLNEALAIIKRCERLFKSAANAWERGNASDNMDAAEKRADSLRDKAEAILAPLGIKCDYPGLYPSFQLTITEWGRTLTVHEYNVQGAVNQAMQEIERKNRAGLVQALQMVANSGPLNNGMRDEGTMARVREALASLPASEKGGA